MTSRLVCVFSFLLSLASVGHADVEFAGGNTGVIPDASATGRTVTFNVSGLTSPIERVALRMELAHTWRGDLTATLIAPNGVAQLVVFGRSGVQIGSTFGRGNDLSGVYEFSDVGGTTWWTDTTNFMPIGTYRTTTRGDVLSFVGGCSTTLAAVFGGLTPAQANGQWQLLLVDAVSPDQGSIQSATLILGVASLFRNGFENVALAGVQEGIAPPACRRTYADFDGNGLSDFTLLRAAGSDIEWTIRPNLGTTEGTDQSFQFGSSTDFLLELDYDGDGIADPAIWRTGAVGEFLIRRSSRPGGAPLSVPLGTTGDDPIQSGDYNGDGRDDLAVFRETTVGSGPRTLIIRDAASGATRQIDLGVGSQGSAFVIAGYDHTGDFRADVAYQTADPGNTTLGLITILNGANGAFLQSFNLGTSSDFLIPGNMTGNYIADVTVRRTLSGVREHTTRDVFAGATGAVVTFGITGDASLVGDFDGDGLQDYAVWRPSATAGASKFIIRPSALPANPDREVLMGASGDYAVGAARVH